MKIVDDCNLAIEQQQRQQARWHDRSELAAGDRRETSSQLPLLALFKHHAPGGASQLELAG